MYFERELARLTGSDRPFDSVIFYAQFGHVLVAIRDGEGTLRKFLCERTRLDRLYVGITLLHPFNELFFRYTLGGYALNYARTNAGFFHGFAIRNPRVG